VAPALDVLDSEAERIPSWAYEDAVHPEGYAGPVGPTPFEETQDLAAREALRERRKTSQPLARQSWDKLPGRTKALLAMMGPTAPEAEAAFDADLDASIAEAKARVRALRLRGLLRPRAVRPAQVVRVRESRPRTRRRRSRGPRVSRAGPDGDSEPPGVGPSPPRGGPDCVGATA
jgi:hypothetical protein